MIEGAGRLYSQDQDVQLLSNVALYACPCSGIFFFLFGHLDATMQVSVFISAYMAYKEHIVHPMLVMLM